MRRVQVKVCGMREPANMAEISALGVDFLGLIFCEDSPRSVRNLLSPSAADGACGMSKRIGVFVDQSEEEVAELAKAFRLDGAQLHGDESPNYCLHLRQLSPGLKIIKSFSVQSGASFSATESYVHVADLFHFDSDGPARGGNGIPFVWDLLERYHGEVPFILAGGVSPGHAEMLRTLADSTPALFGIDLNSRFETTPGVKNPALIRDFLESFHG